MNRELCREFIELAFHKINNSTWDFDQAARELERQFEAEATIWKRQDEEANSVFFGKSYI